MAAPRVQLRDLLSRFCEPLRAVMLPAADEASQPGTLPPALQDLVQLVHPAERQGQQQDFPLAADTLHQYTYDALLISFLAKRVEYRLFSVAAVHARVVALNAVVHNELHTAGSALPDYNVLGLCCSWLSPTTLVRHKNTLYVASRGTSSLLDVIAVVSIYLRQVADNSGLPQPARVHTGFLHAVSGQMHAVIAMIEQDSRGLNVVFCGHSLGGAVAQLMGLAYAHARRRKGVSAYVSTVISFGSPRIGDADLGGHLARLIDHRRLYVEGDPIAAVPNPALVELRVFARVAADYAAHTARQHWQLPPTGRAERTDDATAPTATSVSAVRRVARHALTTYAARLAEHHGASRTAFNAQLRRQRG
ncbi:hypothetical protein BU14_0785s0008 [Porphyra umbilicalis]|uniref:Fungal lipase-type domain-containing protein n=1 Tax=Porphyra umbilicalis TaxID=2786 RepID=A0A1X6NNZ1_PORUM|nr:hypothetical protein BU14_0785s0008 [Porphyra umbilicalis]|eukprot:OSX70331.1 hypothetical protein BU14_0785s0008 [Porphyra umbilicalis]